MVAVGGGEFGTGQENVAGRRGDFAEAGNGAEAFEAEHGSTMGASFLFGAVHDGAAEGDALKGGGEDFFSGTGIDVEAGHGAVGIGAPVDTMPADEAGELGETMGIGGDAGELGFRVSGMLKPFVDPLEDLDAFRPDAVEDDAAGDQTVTPEARADIDMGAPEDGAHGAGGAHLKGEFVEFVATAADVNGGAIAACGKPRDVGKEEPAGGVNRLETLGGGVEACEVIELTEVEAVVANHQGRCWESPRSLGGR